MTSATVVSRLDEPAHGHRRARETLVGDRPEHGKEEERGLDALVRAYQGLALSLAGRFAKRGEALEDLNQVALMGLLMAIERFDPERGTQLTTYATATILGELKRHLRDRSWSVKPPRRVHDLYMSCQQAIDELSQAQGRSPTVGELASYLCASEQDVTEALYAGGLRTSTPIGAFAVEEDDFADTRLGCSDDAMVAVEERVVLTPLLARLPERERRVVTLRFVGGWTQTQIGMLVGASQMQVSRMLDRSLAKLRSWSAGEGI